MSKDKQPADPRTAHVSRLHTSYQNAELRLLIGAGVSIPSGFPNWAESVSRMLSQFLETHVSATYGVADKPHVQDHLVQTMIPGLISEMQRLWGIETLTDFVATKSSNSEWTSYVRHALYGGRRAGELVITPLQLQIARLGTAAEIYTTNFDMLLELALYQLDCASAKRTVDVSQRYSWHAFRCIPKEAATKKKIKHLHGAVDPDGAAVGQLIFADTDYQELFANPQAEANQMLEVLEASGATLILGMSLADPNLRRLLYLRRKHYVNRSQLRGDLYCVMKIDNTFLADYVAQYWQEWGVKILRIGEFDELPGLLRDVEWGPTESGSVPRSVHRATKLIETRLPTYPFPGDWLEMAQRVLFRLESWIRDFYALQARERLSISVFAPLEIQAGEIQLHEVASTEMSLEDYDSATVVRERSLRLEKDREQGVAGWAFASGLIREVLDMGEGMDAQFTEEMKVKFLSKKGYRDWRSILSLPLFDPVERIPIAVMCVNSNMSRPFWTEFRNERGYKFQELLKVTDSTFNALTSRDYVATGKTGETK